MKKPFNGCASKPTQAEHSKNPTRPTHGDEVYKASGKQRAPDFNGSLILEL
jgi:hypothetical protein